MAKGARGNVGFEFNIVEFDTDAGGFAGQSFLAHVVQKSRQIESGTADGQADRVHSASGTVTTSPTTVDLIGSLSSQIDGGSTTSFAELQGLYAENTSSAGNLMVGGGANTIPLTNGTTDEVLIPPGGWIYVDFGTAGLALTAGTADLLLLAASAGSVGFRLAVVGRSA